MEQTDAATVAEPQEEATTSEPLEIDDALDSIFSQSEETEKEQPTSDDEPDDPEMVQEEEPESQDSEEIEEEEEDETPSTGVDKRIHQLVAQKNKLRDKLDEAEERLAALEQKGNEPAPKEPSPWTNSLSQITDGNELQQKVDAAHQMKDWALRNLDGGEVPGADGETQYIDAEQVRTALANAEKVLRDAPKQAQVVRIRQDSLAEAETSYPWLKDKSSENYQILQNELGIWGDFKVRDLPNLELVFANALMGEMARQQKTAKPKSQPEKAPPVVKSTSKPRAKASGKKDISKVKQQYLETGDDHALDALIDTFI